MSELIAPGAPSSGPVLPLGRAAAKRVGQALWVVILPAILAVLVLRLLVPPVGTGFAGLISTAGGRFPLPFGVALFVLFSALAHHWRAHLPEPVREWVVPVAANKKKSARGETVSLILVLAGAIGAAVAVRAFVRPYRVVSSSMLPTLEPDDLVLGRMLSPGKGAVADLRRGDVVVFRGAAVPGIQATSHLPDVVVKRVIGLPGDRIEMQGSQPVINGWTVPMCEAGEYIHVPVDPSEGVAHAKLFVEFLDDREFLVAYSIGAPFRSTYVVKPGEVFVLGDNRANSLDSRAYDGGRGGGVPGVAIEARVSAFLIGTQPSGDTDYARFLGRIDAPHARLPLPFPVASLDDGIARCLANRPKEAHPPPP